MALDLDHLQNLSAAFRTTDSDIAPHVKLNLEAGHHNILHGLVQTAPITKQSLQHVPADQAAEDPGSPPLVGASRGCGTASVANC